MSRVIVLDIGAIQFRAIFSYLSIYKKQLEKIIEDKEIIDIQAKRELEHLIQSRMIYIANPDYTFCNMVSGYYNQLKVTLDDLIIAAQDFSSWRKDISKVYKSQRRNFLIEMIMKSLYVSEDEAKEWIQNQYDKFDLLYKALNMSLPIYFIKIFKAEADDIGSTCCRYYLNKEIILITTDADWTMLAYFKNVRIWSPVTKKFEDIKNPMQILMDKINGDRSDNLLDKPSNELEWENRKRIVDLISPLPSYIEQPIREQLDKIMPKNLYISKIPFRSMQQKFAKIYKIGE